jgi:hypothetical protein
LVQRIGYQTANNTATALGIGLNTEEAATSGLRAIAQKVLGKAIKSNIGLTLLGLGVIGLVIAAGYVLIKLIQKIDEAY